MFYSQTGQDQYLEEHVFKGYKQGVFMDIGAHNGIDINNTLYFEKQHGWNGINVEANPSVYKDLTLNRPHNININCAVCNQDGVSEFICNTGYTEGLSGLSTTYDPRHMNRLMNENRVHKSTTQRIAVDTKRMETICDEHNIKHVNYLSIDVEGGEMEVIKSINFDKMFIDVIGFENNYPDTSVAIVTYLKSKHYVMLKQYDDIFMIHKDSKFL